MERNIRADDAVCTVIAHFTSNRIAIIEVFRREVILDFGWVNRLVQRSHSDDVETVGQSANANSGLSRWFLCGRECPLHQNKDHTRKHNGDGKQEDGSNNGAHSLVVGRPPKVAHGTPVATIGLESTANFDKNRMTSAECLCF